MNARRWGGICICVVGLTGCARFESHGTAYQQAQARAALAIPPDLQTPVNEEQVPAAPAGPGAGAGTPATGATVASGSPAVLAGSAAVRLVRAGGQRWLRVQAAPGVVWSLAQAFFRARGFQIAHQDAAAGLFATDWRSHPARLEAGTTEHYVGQLFPSLFEAGREQRYRVRLEADRRAGATEVYVSREAVREVILADAVTGGATHNWQLDAPSPERDAQALSELMAYLNQQRLPPAVPAASGPGSSGPAGAAGSAGMSPLSATLPAGAGGSGEKAVPLAANQMAAPDGPYAWQRLGVALAESGAVVQAADRALGSYRVRLAQAPTAAHRLKVLLARRRRNARAGLVTLRQGVVTITPAPMAVALLGPLRNQFR
ncbi:MAG TPA: outer membrane protein assembly factor BamC [Acidiferrobacteraceae bacterium]|nr:outer membrane protein assembly factor BamC [Acidiferrobacteraceae bacterium]